MKKTYYFTITSHDYFEHFGARLEPQTKRFETLTEAFAAWKKSRNADFCWEGDHERWTSDLRVEWIPDQIVSHKHGFVLGHAPTEADRTNKEAGIYFRRSLEATTKFERAYWEAATREVRWFGADTPWKSVPVIGFDGTVVDHYKIKGYGPLVTYYQVYEGWVFDGNKFISDDQYAAERVSRSLARATSTKEWSRTYRFEEDEDMVLF